MTVQLLSFPGCPNADAAREALRRALVAAGLPPWIEEVDVTAPGTPAERRDWGSPTILVDGRDVAGSGPTGPSCRLYDDAKEGTRGVPPDELIRKAVDGARRRPGQWARSLALLPGALLPLLPSATCPACIAAYAGVLFAIGLGFLFDERVLAPLIVAFLAVGLVSVAWSTVRHRRAGPLVATVLGSAAVVTGRLVWSLPAVLSGGVALLIGASLWNLWLKRPRQEPLVRLRLARKEGTAP